MTQTGVLDGVKKLPGQHVLQLRPRSSPNLLHCSLHLFNIPFLIYIIIFDFFLLLCFTFIILIKLTRILCLPLMVITGNCNDTEKKTVSFKGSHIFWSDFPQETVWQFHFCIHTQRTHWPSPLWTSLKLQQRDWNIKMYLHNPVPERVERVWKANLLKPSQKTKASSFLITGSSSLLCLCSILTWVDLTASCFHSSSCRRERGFPLTTTWTCYALLLEVQREESEQETEQAIQLNTSEMN